MKLFPPLMSKYSPQHPVLRHLQYMFFPHPNLSSWNSFVKLQNNEDERRGTQKITLGGRGKA
jgi:hypothetical protein